MKQYLELGKKILNEGNWRGDRTGTGTIGLFGAQLVFDLAEGFPLPTTRRIAFKPMIAELLWFLEGSTNNKRLNELGAKIWDPWALKTPVIKDVPYELHERCSLYAREKGVSVEEARKALNVLTMQGGLELALKEVEKYNIPETYPKIVIPEGDLGPIYGKQWRNFGGVDQITELIQNLKTRPYSRRHVITAWNPAELPDESISIQDNVRQGKMALAPCHCLFQFYVSDMDLHERGAIAGINTTAFIGHEYNATGVALQRKMDNEGIPKHKLSCQLYQRSADFPLGSAFNIPSYSLLLMMIAQCVDMVPGTFTYTLGDVHVYANQVELFKEQVERDPLPLCQMKINPTKKDIFSFTMEDFEIVNYQHHSPIAYPVSV